MNRVTLTSLLAACAFAAACPASTSGSEARPGTSAAAHGGKGGCEGASLALDPTTVVGSLDGMPITMKDLGAEVASAESKALRSYCDGLEAARHAALESYVNEKLVAAAAGAAGKETNDYVKERVTAASATPTDSEIQAFYDSRKTPDAPPLDKVKPQVVAAIQRTKAQGAIEAMLTDLRKTAKFEEKLPDVRSPAVQIDIPSTTAVSGNKDAKVRFVEFADFQCPYCSKAAENVKQLKAKFGDRVEFAYRHFPLSFHEHAPKAAEIAQCAAAQGKFWEMHDKMYASQQALGEPEIKGYAKDLGLDMTALDKCLASGDAGKQVDEDFKKGQEIGVEGTPAFYINGRPYAGNPTLEGMSEALEKALAQS